MRKKFLDIAVTVAANATVSGLALSWMIRDNDKAHAAHNQPKQGRPDNQPKQGRPDNNTPSSTQPTYRPK